MTYLVAELINKAYYLSGVVSRTFETTSGDNLKDGLDLLNALLAIKTANNRLIPYFTLYQFNTIAGQETYFIANLISIETMTFNLQTVRFSMNQQSRKMYFGSPRVDGIQALPFDGHIERTQGGSNIYLYFLPNDVYPVKITGKFSLSSVTADTDLSTIMEPFYIEYLRYALAEYICAENGIVFQPMLQMKLDEYEELITDISPIDFTVTKRSTLQSGDSINWAYINFPGWAPS